ncbi:MAG TPA: menaquinone biosynthesis decarboxylase [Candidatus Baltobacteraceae bacterium]|jgi:4-hydroxy-3-polyprenylbenzoate decarboxylase|nr:menaquinone biosynthesis decarboxylase [Candidatus Baltobacteraceae bacterium]
MAYSSFRRFLDALEQAGELKRIPVPVDTDLLIAEWANREMKSPGGGKALLFEHPIVDGKQSEFPIAINTMGSRRRMALALQVADIGDVAQEIQLILKAKPPTDLREGWSLLKQGIHLLHARPKHVSEGACQEVVYEVGKRPTSNAQRPTHNDFTLHDLPILKCWPKDGGRFITLANVHTHDPETGARNVGIYRMQIYDERTTAMHWQIHKVGARHGKRYYERGERMPVAVTLGGDPVYTFAATAPLPDGLDELLFAGFLRRKSIELVRCKTIDVDVPADADFVLEGYVQPGEMRPEGPFGDHTGFYTAVEDYPVFHLTAITHRRAAVYPTTIVGIPPMEDYYIGDACVRIFLPVFKMNFPEIVDMTLPPEGVFHNLVFVSIRKQYPYQAFKVMHGLWGMGQMMFSKYIVAVDEDCDVHNTSEVLFRLCANTDPARDTTVIKNPSDSLDHAPSDQNIGSHMGFDATRKLPGENYRRPWPELLKMTEEAQALVDALQAQTR